MLNIFKLKGPPKTAGKIEYDNEGVSEFKYFKNADKEFAENLDGDPCVCCGKISKYIYKHVDILETDFESADNSDDSFEIGSSGKRHKITLCSACIANGKAAKKLKSEFNSSYCMERCKNKAAKNEVRYQTPSVFSFQEFLWPSCCDDMCQYVGNLNDEWHDASKITTEIDPLIIEAIKNDETFIDIDRPLEELVEACNQNEMSVLIFRCLHCGKYRVIIDLD